MICSIEKDINKLHEPSKEVDMFDSAEYAHARKVIKNLRDTLKNSKNGVGLAAPQIGEHIRVFLFTLKSKEVIAIINPEIVQKKGRTIYSTEGCLSFPGQEIKRIPRSNQLRIEGFDEDGFALNMFLSELSSIIFQHELDHLDGKVIIDYKPL
jgi:peptide deformylase